MKDLIHARKVGEGIIIRRLAFQAGDIPQAEQLIGGEIDGDGDSIGGTRGRLSEGMMRG
jgi:hypothetical protein